MIRKIIITKYFLYCLCAIQIFTWTLATKKLNAGLPRIEIPSSFNPVGSGARAMGMGGAFLSIADDATASSWNPGALINLKKTEYSLVITHDNLMEKNHFGFHNEASGKESVSNMTINYLSIAYPFTFNNNNMVLALSAQRLYSLNRNWNFLFAEEEEFDSYRANWSYEQTGDLYAIGLSWCIELLQPKLALGLTLNLWKDGILGDSWEKKCQVYRNGIYSGIPYVENDITVESYDLSGLNFNLGLVWDINDQWRLGAVVKTPFNADMDSKFRNDYSKNYIVREPIITNQSFTLEMPLSYGLGVLYKLTDNFYLAADFYETKWNHFLLKKQDGQNFCPISGLPRSEFSMDETFQLRIGGEYIWLDTINRRLIPLRFGFFYDPMPSENHGDDIYGFSLGTGWTLVDHFSIDIAYQFRYGKNIGEQYLQDFNFSQNIRESIVYCSLILYQWE